MVSEDCVAVGNTYGLVLHMRDGSYKQAWYGEFDAVVSVCRFVGGDRVDFCTANQYAYTYCISTDSITRLHPRLQVFCVSGPIQVVGTPFGTYPDTSICVPCTQIVQSATLVCAWHTTGHVVTFSPRTMQRQHLFDTGVMTVTKPLSLIADMVCIGSMVWRNGTRYSTCPCFPRACSADGLQILIGFT